jgi:surfactin synthase thioesterase subunit
MDLTAASLSLTSSSVISTDSHSLSSDHLILNRDGNQPSLSLFGHNLGGIIAFEVAREIERATRVTLPAPPLHALLVSGCRPPLALTQFNKDEKSRKFSRDSNKLLLDRMIELGCVPSYLLSRRDMLQPYLSRFRSGPLLSLVLPILTSLSAVSLLYGSEYRAMETYRYLRQLGTTQGSAPLKCEIVAMCGGNDKTVSERLLMQWGDMTTGSFQHHIFDHGDHYYWLPRHNQGQLQGVEEESVGGGRSSASVESALRSHENDFLRLLIRSSNPFHILLSEDEAGVGEGEEEEEEEEEEGDDQKSAVSSVTFQDSYRSSLPTARSARQGQEAAEEKMNSSCPSSRGRGRRSEDK